MVSQCCPPGRRVHGLPLRSAETVCSTRRTRRNCRGPMQMNDSRVRGRAEWRHAKKDAEMSDAPLPTHEQEVKAPGNVTLAPGRAAPRGGSCHGMFDLWWLSDTSKMSVNGDFDAKKVFDKSNTCKPVFLTLSTGKSQSCRTNGQHPSASQGSEGNPKRVPASVRARYPLRGHVFRREPLGCG